MKNNVLILFLRMVILCLGIPSLFVFPEIVHAATKPAETGFVVLEVTGDNVRLRSSPSVEGEGKIVAVLPAGALLLAETWPIEDDSGGMSWFAVANVLDSTGENSNTEIADNSWSPVRYVSASYVERTERKIPVSAYVRGYGAVDSSLEAQRRMAENSSVKNLIADKKGGQQRIPVYAEPATSSTEINIDVTDTEHFPYSLVGVDGVTPGWMLLVDLAGRLPSCWAESKQVSSHIHSSYGNNEAAYLVALTLGANVPEIMRRWGPGSIKRTVAERWSGLHVDTKLSFEGFEVVHTDYDNFEFILTRKGAGIGGIFIDTDWCDKDYIEKIFGGQFTIEKYQRDGHQEHWQFGGGPDGWHFGFSFTFDAKGLVQKFEFNCAYVNLS